jgi:hypothetical protein
MERPILIMIIVLTSVGATYEFCEFLITCIKL